MKFYQLTYLVEVANEKSFNRAAKNLYTSPSNVMVAINSLEEELGYKLLLRSSKGVCLTAEGQRVLQDAIKMLAIQSKWENPDRATRNSIAVQLFAVPSAYHGIIPQIIHRASKIHPEISCHTHETFAQEIDKNLPFQNNSLSITCLHNRQAEQELLKKSKNWDISVQKLCNDNWNLFLGSSHSLAEQEIVSWKDLLAYSFCCSTFPIYHPFYQDIYKQTDILYIENHSHCLHAVAHHNKIAILPALLSNTAYVRNRQIVTKPLPENAEPLKFYLFAPKESNRNQQTQHIIDIIMDCFASYTQKMLDSNE